MNSRSRDRLIERPNPVSRLEPRLAPVHDRRMTTSLPMGKAVRALIVIATVGILGFGATACNSASNAEVDKNNTYADAMNDFQKQTQTFAATQGCANLTTQSAAATSMQTDVQKMQAAQGALTGQAATIAAQVSTAAQSALTAAQQFVAACQSGNEGAQASSNTAYNAQVKSINTLVDQWNAMANAKNAS